MLSVWHLICRPHSTRRHTSQAGGCGCSGPSAPAATNGQDAASSVMHQLNSMMGGMEGSLTRDDFRAAFEAAAPRQVR